LKPRSSVTLRILVATMLLSSCIPAFGITIQPHLAAFGAPKVLQVWFDPTQFVSSGPCAYLLSVHAQTSHAFSITSVNWNFGDGSTLNFPYSGQSLVSDARTHVYSVQGTYMVRVTAYDNAGNSGTGVLTLPNVTPGSCVIGSDPATGNVQVTVHDNNGNPVADALVVVTPSTCQANGVFTAVCSSSPPYSTPTQFMCTTNLSGQCTISNLLPGLYGAGAVWSSNGYCILAIGPGLSAVNISSGQTAQITVTQWFQVSIPPGGFGGTYTCNPSSLSNVTTPSTQVTTPVTAPVTTPVPTSYSIAFSQSGDCCVGWSVTLNGATESSQPSNIYTIIFSEPNGVYPYTITPPTGFVAQPQSGTVTVNGENVQVNVNFAPITTPIMGTLQVLVSDQTTGNPISGALVQMTSAPAGQSLLSCTTDPSGQCSFQNVVAGSYTVSASANGYQQATGSGNFPAGQTGQTTLALSKSAVTPQYSILLSSGSGGSFTYSYLGNSGTVQSGQAQSINIPAGTQLSLNATADPQHIFQSWSSTGSVTFSSSSSLSTTITVDGNGSATASFTTPSSTSQEPIITSVCFPGAPSPCAPSTAYINQPYNVVVTVQNPDPNNPHTYTLQLKQNPAPATVFQFGPQYPSWEVPLVQAIGAPTQWQTYPRCQVSGVWEDVNTAPGNCIVTQSETVPPGATASFTFTFTNTWQWIPAWTWSYLAATAIGTVTGVIAYDLQVARLAQALQSLTPLVAASYAVANEQFNFQLLYGSTPVQYSQPLQSTVIVGDAKIADYVSTVIASFSGGLATVDGIVGCLIGIACGWPLLIQAELIAGQNLAYVAASDPDPDYTQVIQLTPLTLENGTLLVNLPFLQSLPSDQRAMLQTLASELSYQNATTISITRYNGALEAGSQFYANLQLQAIQNYAPQRDQYLAQFVNQLSLTTPLPQFNSTSVQSVKDYLQKNGLPVIEQQILTGLGLSSSIADVTAGMTLFNATSLNQFTLVDGMQALQSTLANETSLWKAQASAGQSAATVSGPSISSVSQIVAADSQTIYIYGSGFGNTPPQTVGVGDGSVDTYACNVNTPSLAIWDNSGANHNWSAGRESCTNFDSIGIMIASWSDSEIVLGGFGSALSATGTGTWNISPGDSLTINVWGPNNDGQAQYNLVVSGSATTTSPATTTTAPVTSSSVTTAFTQTSSTATIISYSPTTQSTTSPSGSALTCTYVASPSSGAASLTVQFNVSCSGGSQPYTYEWTFGDGSRSTSSLQSSTHTYSTGVYPWGLFVIDAAGNVYSVAGTITIR
jgi:hypothetical protein